MRRHAGIRETAFVGLCALLSACGDSTATSESFGNSASATATATATGSTGGGSATTTATETTADASASESGSSGTNPPTTGVGSSGGVETGSTSGAETGSTGNVSVSVSGDPGTGGTTGIDQCAGSVVLAEPIPLDIYVMLDKSGSMTEKTGMKGMGLPKWDAVTGALTSFFEDPQSTGIGVGLQYFPLRDDKAPASCKSQADCGMFGPCLLKVCSANTGIVCTANSDCGNQGPCTNLGQCANDPATLCLPIGAQCPGNKGQCVQVTTSVCLGVDSCVADDYATPAVPVGVLGDAAPALIASMNMTTPEGATPTGPALQGAIDYARDWATANPTHKVVALLATDGLPTECAPLDNGGLAQIAAAGLAGDPSIPTFVIGVFAGNDMAAKATIDAIAAAGGTDQGFYIDANQNVDQAFLDALNAIRGAKLACEYQIPPPPMGESLDFDKVNVLYKPEGQNQSEPIFYVGSADNCDPVTGGWYYDVDPMMGGTPTKIIVCPETCAAFGLGGQVDIQLGCETVIPG